MKSETGESSPSPLPWSREGRYTIVGAPVPHPQKPDELTFRQRVATVAERVGQRDANAELIVRAVNHHGALVEALRKLANEVRGLQAFEIEIREVIGNTNWQCIAERVGAAQSLLSELEASE